MQMNVKHLIAALAVAVTGGSVMAGDTDYPYVDHSNVVSSKTRAEVIAEIAQARADGTLAVGDTTYPRAPAITKSKTRAEVRAELDQYQKAHPYGDESLYRGT
jgi:Domain of unknown function (DUF4148)